MKRVRIIAAASAAVLAVGGLFATKANTATANKTSQVILYHQNAQLACTQIKCTTVQSAIFCTVLTNLYTNINGDNQCVDPVSTPFYFTQQS